MVEGAGGVGSVGHQAWSLSRGGQLERRRHLRLAKAFLQTVAGEGSRIGGHPNRPVTGVLRALEKSYG